MNYRIPTIEEIYNEYHRESMFAMKGFYPKSIKNFDKSLSKEKIEFLTKYQNVIKRNYDLIDWKIYIKACAQYFKRNFDLKVLGSLQGNKIYRMYISYHDIKENKNDIESEIFTSIKFIKNFCENNEMKFKDYFYDRSTNLPIILKHIYSGSVSPYFYATFSHDDVFLLFGNIPDDCYYELFNCSRTEFLENNINQKHDTIIRSSKLLKIINIINEKFKSIFEI